MPDLIDVAKNFIAPIVISIIGTVLIFTPLAPVGLFLLKTASAMAVAAIIQSGMDVIEEFMDKPSGDLGAGQEAMDRQHISVNPNAQGKIIWGQTAAATDIVYGEQGGNNNERMLFIIATAAHQIESYGDFYVNDELLSFSGDAATGDWANTLWKREALGTLTQTQLITGAGFAGVTNWDIQSDANFIGLGHAYYALGIRLGKDKTGQGVPTRITQVVKGCPVYDPRLDGVNPEVGGVGTHDYNDQSTWEYNDGTTDIGENWALCVLTYLLGWHDANAKSSGDLVWGVGVSGSEINWDQAIEAANVCEQTRDSKPRYRIGGIMAADNNHERNIKQFEASIGGRVAKIGGKYFIWAPHDDLTPYTTISETDLLKDAPIEYVPAGPMDRLYNTARGQYISPDDLYQFVPYPEVVESSAVTEDGRERVKNISFPLIQDVEIAERVARMLVRRSRFSAVWRYAMSPKGLLSRPFTVNTLNIQETANADQDIRVIDMEYTMEGVVVMSVVEEDSSIYDATAALGTPATQQDPSTFDGSVRVEVSGLASENIVLRGTEGETEEALKITWDDPDTIVEETIIQVKKATDADWGSRSRVKAKISVDGSVAYIRRLPNNTLWDIRAKHVTIFGRASLNWASVQDSTGTQNLPLQFTPGRAWTFQGNVRGWTATGAAAAVDSDNFHLEHTSSGTDPKLISPTISIAGINNPKVRVGLKRRAGSGWTGRLRYSTGSHGFSDSYVKDISDITVTDTHVTLEWDMSDIEGGGSSTDWIDNTITALEFELGSTASDDFDISVIIIGDAKPVWAPSGAGSVYFGDGSDGISGASVQDRDNNLDFEAGGVNWENTTGTGWGIINDSAEAKFGSFCGKVTAGITNDTFQNTYKYACEQDDLISIIGYGRISSGVGTMQIFVQFYDSSEVALGASIVESKDITEADTTYTKLYRSILVPATAVYYRAAVKINPATSAVTGYIDGITVDSKTHETSIKLKDDVSIYFGTDDDCQIFYSSADDEFRIDNYGGTADLRMRTGGGMYVGHESNGTDFLDVDGPLYVHGESGSSSIEMIHLDHLVRSEDYGIRFKWDGSYAWMEYRTGYSGTGNLLVRERLTANVESVELYGNSGSRELYTASGGVYLDNDLYLGDDNLINLGGSYDFQIKFDATDDRGHLSMATNNGSDNKSISINGGGDQGWGRGAQVDLYGNEDTASPGELSLAAGNIGTGDVVLYTGGVESGRLHNEGYLNWPRLPAFLAYLTTSESNVTGNGTTHTITFDTEVYDQGADFSGSTFTAPVTGIYHFDLTVRLGGITAAADSIVLWLSTSNRSYYWALTDTDDLPSPVHPSISIDADMDAGDTAVIKVIVNGEASDVVDVIGDTTPVIQTRFSGRQVA